MTNDEWCGKAQFVIRHSENEHSALRPNLLRAWISGESRLVTLDQFLDASRVGFVVAMARQRIRAAGRFNQNVRPDEPGFDVNGSDLAHADADFIALEPGALVPGDGLLVHFNIGREKEISLGPAARLKYFSRHIPGASP